MERVKLQVYYAIEQFKGTHLIIIYWVYVKKI